MICNRCGHEVRYGNICPNCGIDVVLFQKTRTASLRQYNKGVAFAREGDYSSAIDCLRECLLFDKHNFVARNLLGIAYFQVGLVTEALKEWIISASIRKEKNPAQKYIDSLQKEARTLDKYSDAISMYNNALEQFKAENYDLAVIQLKKAVDTNPALVCGCNLLSAYFMSVNEKSKAKKYIYKALKVDKKNPMALGYLAEITQTDKAPSSKDGYSETGYNENASGISYKIKHSIRADAVFFILGVVVSAAVFFTLVMPSINNMNEERVNELTAQVSRLEEENLNGTSTFAIKYKNMEDELEKLRQENEQYEGEYSVKQRELDIEAASNDITAGRYYEAADILYSINTDNLSDDDMASINSLRAQCYPQAAEMFFESGEEKFNNGDMENAKIDLEKSFDMASDQAYSDNAIYILAQISESEGDTSKAREYYERILNDFTTSDVFELARTRITEMEMPQ